MENKKKKTNLIGFDIPAGYLEFLEDLLFNKGIYRESNSLYINGQQEEIEYDLSNIEYAKFMIEYRDVLTRSRSKNLSKIFKTFNVVFDYYQCRKSRFRSYLLADPSLIDDTDILSKYLVGDNLLVSVLNTIDVAIDSHILELYDIHGIEVLKKANRIDYYILDTIELMSKIAEEMYALIEEHSMAFDFSNGKHYKLNFYKGVVIAEELEDIRVVRYKNIISKSREKIKKTDDDIDTDIPEEHLEVLLAMKLDESKYNKILLNRLVYTTEKLDEFECKFVDRSVTASLNIEVPIEEGEYDE